jgi:hypothetical protein
MAEAEDQAGFSPLSKGTDTAMRGGGRGSRGRGKRGRGGRGGSGAGRGAKAAAASSSLPHSSGAIKKAPRRGRYKQFPTEKLQASSERRQEIQTAWRRYASISKSLLVTITDLQQHKIMTDPHFMAEEKVAINSQLHDRCSAAIHTAKMFRRFQVDSTDKELAVQKTYTAKACEVSRLCVGLHHSCHLLTRRTGENRRGHRGSDGRHDSSIGAARGAAKYEAAS